MVDWVETSSAWYGGLKCFISWPRKISLDVYIDRLYKGTGDVRTSIFHSSFHLNAIMPQARNLNLKSPSLPSYIWNSISEFKCLEQVVVFSLVHCHAHWSNALFLCLAPLYLPFCPIFQFIFWDMRCSLAYVAIWLHIHSFLITFLSLPFILIYTLVPLPFYGIQVLVSRFSILIP